MNFPSLLLFDLGGVLIESSAFESLSRLLPEPLDRTAIKDRWLFSSSVRRFERGEMSSCEFAESFIAEWGLRMTPQVFVKEFASWPREFFPGARETIHHLRKNYQVGCLSNSNPLHWERFRGLEDDFDIALFSHLLGAIKPDLEIFTLALGRCDVDPAEVYFFDDCSANVDTAQSLGITAFHVDGFQSLQNVLLSQGLLSNAVER
ncbi:putative hydrolase of the HAD superfamily [Methylobacter tundripaludum]|uniref:Putative hydrolase of the HAD superfamily n=1 Tax=Methylobacter tundripaludum TaxID=173365 RepID=A0A2S6H7M3_9GAMM|nr:HAD family phosphatase [Methylobacter tundripaludum]PPK73489.1 putative hydrolase of the HAD superfamily [Methylobacter tundripaludum]